MAGVYVLMPAAGRGDRFGGTVGKLFEPLRGRPVIEWSIEAALGAPSVRGIVLAAPPDRMASFESIARKLADSRSCRVVAGGADRQESVAAAMAVVPDAEGFLVHDAARPCATGNLFELVWDAARKCGAATAAVPVHDTLVRCDQTDPTRPPRVAESVDRERVWRIQTPQGFRAEVLRSAHAHARGRGIAGTDDAGLVRAMGGEVRLVVGDEGNVKVTRPEDLETAERVLASRDPATGRGGWSDHIRIGYGFDVHATATDRPLRLGGVDFPEAGFGLLGHSDADVVLHAVCDALLGAAGLGDIGHLFPDNDPAHKDRASIEFVVATRSHLVREGWDVGNLDVTLLAEAPRIAGKAEEMRARIATALEIPPSRVSIKATTNEKLGHIGRREGLAAHAVALLHRRRG